MNLKNSLLLLLCFVLMKCGQDPSSSSEVQYSSEGKR